MSTVLLSRGTYGKVSGISVDDIAWHTERGFTQYTAVQILMAHDEFCAAVAEYNTALDAIELVRDAIDASGLKNSEYDTALGTLNAAVTAIDNKVNTDSPLEHLRARHSSERFPVDKTLREAAKLRNAAKKLHKLATD